MKIQIKLGYQNWTYFNNPNFFFLIGALSTKKRWKLWIYEQLYTTFHTVNTVATRIIQYSCNGTATLEENNKAMNRELCVSLKKDEHGDIPSISNIENGWMHVGMHILHCGITVLCLHYCSCITLGKEQCMRGIG